MVGISPVAIDDIALGEEGFEFGVKEFVDGRAGRFRGA